MKLIFCLQINIKIFFKLILAFSRYAQVTQNNKFTISLQYLIKNEIRSEVNFLYAGKHEGLLQIEITIFDGDCQKFP